MDGVAGEQQEKNSHRLAPLFSGEKSAGSAGQSRIQFSTAKESSTLKNLYMAGFRLYSCQ
jgi:hypothetical protein